MGKQSISEQAKKAKIETKPKTEKPLKKANPKSQDVAVSPVHRVEMIATAAYYIAERHGFQPDRAHEDWYEAEQQIDTELSKGTAPLH